MPRFTLWNCAHYMATVTYEQIITVLAHKINEIRAPEAQHIDSSAVVSHTSTVWYRYGRHLVLLQRDR